jgi:hypothetical protein
MARSPRSALLNLFLGAKVLAGLLRLLFCVSLQRLRAQCNFNTYFSAVQDDNAVHFHHISKLKTERLAVMFVDSTIKQFQAGVSVGLSFKRRCSPTPNSRHGLVVSRLKTQKNRKILGCIGDKVSLACNSVEL